jgi:hypothetical protein
MSPPQPPSPPPSPSPDEDRRRLREFLYELRSLLDDFVTNRPSAVPGRFHQSMKAAWDEVKDTNFTRADTALDTSDQTFYTSLTNLGLTGVQLTFKLSIFQHARDELADHSSLPVDQQGPTWWDRWRGRFKYTLRSADVILGSLTKLPVFSILEPVKEFKEGVETALPFEKE